MRLAFFSVLLFSLAACGGGGESPAPKQQGAETAGSSSDFSGVLTFKRDDPYGDQSIVSLSLGSGRLTVKGDGNWPRASSGRLLFIQTCGNMNAGRQIAVQDEDGFTNIMTPCMPSAYSREMRVPALSPDGKRVVLLDPHVLASTSRNGISRYHAAALRLFSGKEEEDARIFGLTAPAFSRDGTLYAAGIGDAARGGRPYGIYKVQDDMTDAQRIDDGRLNSPISSLDINAEGTHAAFVMNGQVWELNLQSGEPRRIITYSHEIGHIAYGPDGRTIAFIARQPLGEARDLEGGYRINIFDRNDIHSVDLSFVPSGPVSWESGAR